MKVIYDCETDALTVIFAKTPIAESDCALDRTVAFASARAHACAETATNPLHTIDKTCATVVDYS